MPTAKLLAAHIDQIVESGPGFRYADVLPVLDEAKAILVQRYGPGNRHSMALTLMLTHIDPTESGSVVSDEILKAVASRLRCAPMATA